MGWKAEFRKLRYVIEMEEKRIEIFNAALKTIVMEKGETEDGSWVMRVPEFVPTEVNEKYSIVTELQDGGYLLMKVTERTEED